MKLVFLKRAQIDTKKWDFCVSNSKNEIIYAYSWYLDTVTKNWSGIISEDYQYVMPIVWNKKYGIKYTFRPFLIQQLGILGSNLDNFNPNDFLKLLTKKFKVIDYNFNYNNNIKKYHTNLNYNFELKLNKTYTELWKNFSKKHQTSIKKAYQNNLIIDRNLNIDKLIYLKKQFLQNNLSQKNFDILKELCIKYSEKSKIYGVYKNSELIAASLYFFNNNKIYYLASVSSINGRKNGATFFLKDTLIKDYANKNFTLDFEGSNINGIKHFFKGWGAESFTYQNLKALSFYPLIFTK